MSVSAKHVRARRRGAVLIAALLSLLVVMLLGGALVCTVIRHDRQNRWHQNQLQAMWLAHYGLQHATFELAANPAYTGQQWQLTPEVLGTEHSGRIVVRVLETDQAKKILVEAYYPDDPVYRVTGRKQITFRTGKSGESS